MNRYDVVVVGAGHAGCEAALAACRLGAETALITISLNEIAKLPCNPAIGGPGKSQLVTEVDALGGRMARVTDESMIHARLLNTSKGPAMQVRRAQADRVLYKLAWKEILEAEDGLSVLEAMVDDVLVRDHRVQGVRLREGLDILAPRVIIAVGTFLNGRILMGDVAFSAGRAGEPASIDLATSLQTLGLSMAKLKTGTPPRVHRASIDTDGMERQATSDQPLVFSAWSDPRVIPDTHPVFVTHTNETTHRIIQDNLRHSANYNGLMSGEGPRHCPSLETKIVRFPERSSHKVFCEPEGLRSAEIYLQGIYTAFSPHVQEMIVHSIHGLEEARIERFGYNIEYDFCDPLQLGPTLEVDGIGGLYLAGQIIGTTGYEEAAAQGLVAGVNAAGSLAGKAAFVPSRSDSFIGVLVDDLVTKGITEPYRMLPSRAEYRIRLREGNADLRLAPIGHALGLVTDTEFESVHQRLQAIERTEATLRETRVGPTSPINEILRERGSSPLSDNGASLYELLRRPEVRLADLIEVEELPPRVASEVEISGKYAGYLAQQDRDAERVRKLEGMAIPNDFTYDALGNLSMEGRILLARVKPRSFGQACRGPGVSQSDLAMLAIYLRR